jgi:hypothetical protein
MKAICHACGRLHLVNPKTGETRRPWGSQIAKDRVTVMVLMTLAVIAAGVAAYRVASLALEWL